MLASDIERLISARKLRERACLFGGILPEINREEFTEALRVLRDIAWRNEELVEKSLNVIDDT